MLESSFRAQISTVQYPSLAYIFACLFVCLFKASSRLVQFVVLWSPEGKASDPQRSRNAKGAGMPIKIQHGEEDGDAQKVTIWLQRVLVLAVCTAEGLIYCRFIPL